MRTPMAIPGLPIAQGSVWRRPKIRAALLAAAGSALLPAALLVHNALTDEPDGRSAVSVAVALCLFALTFAAWQERHLGLRASVGALAGSVGGILAGLLYGVFGPASTGAPTSAGEAMNGAWLSLTTWWVGGAFIGISFALIAGKAHWAWGLIYCALWTWVLETFHGQPAPLETMQPLPAVAAAITMGLSLGLINQWLQPATLPASKIISLQDYKPRRRGRSHGRRLK